MKKGYRMLICILLLLLLSAPAHGEAALAPIGMPVFFGGEAVTDAEGEILTDGDGHFYASADFLCRLIAPDFIRCGEEGGWMIRRLPLEEGAVVLQEGRAFLDLEKADFCLRVDPYWLEAGVFSLLVRFSPVVTVDGQRFESTGETAPVPDRPWDGVSPEGRAFWVIGEDRWLEDEDGLVHRFIPAEAEACPSDELAEE